MRRAVLVTMGLGALGAAWALRPAPIAPAVPAALPPLAPRETLPPPTEHWLDEGAETRNKSRRKEWFKQLHRAPPGVDWKAVERDNGLRRTARRAALAAAPPVDDGTAWVERGSVNQAGRMHVARLSPDHDTLYAGSSLGGVWRGAPDGSGWVPIGDNLYGGAHWLEVLAPGAEGAPDTVIAATDGGLVHRTVDDGATWTVPVGMEGLSACRRLLLTSDGREALFAVVYAGTWSVRRSLDAGATWEEVYALGGFAGDLWTPRDGGDGLYLASGDGLLHSADLGDTWTPAGGLPVAAGTAELAGSEAGAPALWLATDGRELWRSPDAGASWSAVTPLSDYWGALNASVYDPDVFAWGGVEVHVTHDGGASWQVPNAWWEYYGDPGSLLHADIMGLDVVLDGDGTELWFVNTDGGLYRSTDTLRSHQNLSLRGLRVSQYYDVLTSSANPEHVAAGAQDQGYQVTNDHPQDGDLYGFDQILSGDYGHLTSSDGTHEWVYSVYPGFVLIQHGEDAPELEYADFPADEAYVPWLPPILADPKEPRAFFFPATHLYRYTRDRGAWVAARWSEQDFGRGGNYVSALAFSPLEPDLAFAATSDGRLYWSEDQGVTWERSATTGPDENWYYGQALVPSGVDPDVVYVGGSGYGVPAVYRSVDRGRTFEPWSDGLPDTLVYGMAEARDGSGVLVAGTEQAVYRRDPGDDAWREITDPSAPITIYWSVEALAHEPTFRFATYGRGLWDYRLDRDAHPCWPAGDRDEDGHACGDDCDDGDAAVHPGAEETCGDGVDQDCSGADLPCADDPPVPDPDEPAPPAPDGCGCATPGVPPLGVGLLLALAVRRRRR